MIDESWMEMEIIGKEEPTNFSSFAKLFEVLKLVYCPISNSHN
jgi:hypothetical protein